MTNARSYFEKQEPPVAVQTGEDALEVWVAGKLGRYWQYSRLRTSCTVLRKVAVSHSALE